MHIILTGATGLVGGGALAAMVKMKDITKISVLSRRPVQMAEDLKDPRINVIIHKDFTNYDSELLSKLQGAKGCVWALGISQTQVDKEEYVKITKDYALAAAQAFKGLASSSSNSSASEPEPEPFNFVYVSGGGATTKPGRLTAIYARVKGETELALAALRRASPSLLHASSARPMAVDAMDHPELLPYKPAAPVFGIGLARIVLGPVFKHALPAYYSPTEELGRVLAELAMGRHTEMFTAAAGEKDIEMVGEFPIFENSALRRFAAASSK